MPIKTLDEFLKFNQLNGNIKSKIVEYQPSNLTFKIIGFYKEAHFKHTLLGKIPREWKTIVLDNYVDIETGKRPKGGARSSGDAISLGGEHIDENGRIIWDIPKFIPLEFYKQLNKGKVRQEDILLVKDGAKTGKVAFVDTLPHPYVAVNEHVFIIRSKNQNILINKFLFYVLYSQIGQNQIKQKTHGIIGGIKRQELLSLRIPFPPLEEQWGIAEVLSTVDKAIEKTKELIERLERLKKALMQELLTKGIGHKEYKQTPIGKIPKEWHVVKFGDIADFKNGINFDGRLKGDKGILTVDVLNMYEETIFLNPSKLYRVNVSLKPEYILKKGDILIVRSSLKPEGIGWATLFNGYNEPVTFCGFIIRARLRKELEKMILPEFLTYFLRSEVVRRQLIHYSGRVAITNISQRILKSVKILLPPLSEQQKIVEILLSIDNWIELEKKRKEKLERLKKGLMNLLLSGKIRVKVVKQGVSIGSSSR